MKYIAYLYLVAMLVLILVNVYSVVDMFSFVCLVIASVTSIVYVFKSSVNH
jgi:hypothetical protein